MDLLARATSFVRVVEAGSLSAAARSLALSLPAMSRQIATLEHELGVSLLERTTRHLRVTEEGRRFLVHAIALVREAEAARASVSRGGPIVGELRISTSVSLGLLRIIPALPRLRAAHPGLRLEVRLEERPVELVGEGVDLVVRAGLGLPDTAHLVAHPLASFTRHLVASPRYLRAHGTPRATGQLSHHAAIVGPTSDPRWELEGVAIPIAPALRVGTLVGIRDAAIAGLGIALLPDFVTAEAVAAGALRVVLPAVTASAVVAHALVRVEARGNPRHEAVLAHLRATLPDAHARPPAPKPVS